MTFFLWALECLPLYSGENLLFLKWKKKKKVLDSWLQLATIILQKRKIRAPVIVFFFFFVWGGKLSCSNLGTWVTQFHFTIRNKDT